MKQFILRWNPIEINQLIKKSLNKAKQNTFCWRKIGLFHLFCAKRCCMNLKLKWKIIFWNYVMAFIFIFLCVLFNFTMILWDKPINARGAIVIKQIFWGFLQTTAKNIISFLESKSICISYLNIKKLKIKIHPFELRMVHLKRVIWFLFLFPFNLMPTHTFLLKP